MNCKVCTEIFIDLQIHSQSLSRWTVRYVVRSSRPSDPFPVPVLTNCHVCCEILTDLQIHSQSLSRWTVMYVHVVRSLQTFRSIPNPCLDEMSDRSKWKLVQVSWLSILSLRLPLTTSRYDMTLLLLWLKECWKWCKNMTCPVDKALVFKLCSKPSSLISNLAAYFESFHCPSQNGHGAPFLSEVQVTVLCGKKALTNFLKAKCKKVIALFQSLKGSVSFYLTDFFQSHICN